MPFPTRITRFNRDHLNPYMKRVARFAPHMAVVHHRGRVSGREYSSPVLAFHNGDQWIFALTYGSSVDWVKNVVAAGSFELVVHGRTVRLTHPELIDDPSLRQRLPVYLRPILAAAGVTEFLTAQRVDR